MMPSRIIWHHSAYSPTAPQFELINQWHRDRQFPVSSLGYYVGYHYVIEHDGTIRKAREESEIGAHDQGENLDSVGICFAGDFNSNMPSEAQAAAGATLVADIRARWGIRIPRIEPHRTDDITDCPGKNLADNWLVLEYLKRSKDPLLWIFHYIATQRELI